MSNIGERVDTIKKEVTIGGRDWILEARLYFTGNHYNIATDITEDKLWIINKPEKHDMLLTRADTKDEVSEAIESRFDSLIQTVEAYDDARGIDVTVTIK